MNAPPKLTDEQLMQLSRLKQQHNDWLLWRARQVDEVVKKLAGAAGLPAEFFGPLSDAMTQHAEAIRDALEPFDSGIRVQLERPKQ